MILDGPLFCSAAAMGGLVSLVATMAREKIFAQLAEAEQADRKLRAERLTREIPEAASVVFYYRLAILKSRFRFLARVAAGSLAFTAGCVAAEAIREMVVEALPVELFHDE